MHVRVQEELDPKVRLENNTYNTVIPLTMHATAAEGLIA